MTPKNDYITGIVALNYHHYDWHKCSVDMSRRYPDKVRSWCDWGIENNIANPIRAYLDYLYYNIKFKRRVPNMRIDMFLFDDQEEQEILEKIETLLKPALTDDEELELLALYKDYLQGGKYDFRSKSYRERKARREMLKSDKEPPKKPLREYLQEVDVNQIDLIDLALQYEDTMPLNEMFEILSEAAKKK